jgi:hypothetical protein
VFGSPQQLLVDRSCEKPKQTGASSLVTSRLEGGTQEDDVAATGKAPTSSRGQPQPTTTDELEADGWGRRHRGEVWSREPRVIADGRGGSLGKVKARNLGTAVSRRSQERSWWAVGGGWLSSDGHRAVRVGMDER